MAKAKYTVHCKIHGMLDKNTNMSNVTTSRPTTKKERGLRISLSNSGFTGA